MRLKQIKLAGFKSFVDSTKIPFNQPLTAIIGPNGCGKSNVIDAVRWVLGESSAKHLRGDSMMDVIFNGSSARKPVSVASIELSFENLDGRLAGQYASYQEISVKRQVSRDGDSNYFLNGQKCRRKDITDLFMGTGLGPRSYAIIEQGTISRLIESKPQELRVFIEEAAGISRYKERRRETENRIRHTRENLERLGDIRLELGSQIDKLEQQAQAAKQYREFKQQERDLHAQLLVMRYQELKNQSDNIAQEILQLEVNLAAANADGETTELTLTQLKTQIAELTAAEQQLVAEYYQAGTEIAKLEQQLKHQQLQDNQLEKQLADLISQQQVASNALQTLMLQEQQLTAQLAEGKPELVAAEQALGVIDAQLQDVEQKAADLQQHLSVLSDGAANAKMAAALTQSKLQHQQQMLSQQQKQLIELSAEQQRNTESDSQAELTALDLKLTALKEQLELEDEIKHQLTDELEDKQQQLAQASEDYQQQKQQLSSLSARSELIEQWLTSNDDDQQALWQTIEVTPGWEKAVDVLLQGILATKVIDAGGAIGPSVSGFIATGEVSALNHQISAAVNLSPWLHHVSWCASVDEAKAQLKQLSSDGIIATQDGYLVGHGFVFKKADSKQSQLALKNEYQQLQIQISQLNEQLLQLQQQVSLQTQQVGDAHAQLSQSQLKHHQLQLDCSKLDAQSHSLVLQQQDRLRRQKSLDEQVAQLQGQIGAGQQAIERLTAELELSQQTHQQQLATQQQVNQDWQTASQQLRDYKANRSQQERDSNSCRQKMQQLHTQVAVLQANISQQTQQSESTTAQIKQLRESSQQTNASLGEQQLQQLQTQLNAQLDIQQAKQQLLNSNRTQQAELQTRLDSAVLIQKQQLGALQNLTQSLSGLKLRREGLKGQADGQFQLLEEQQIKIQDVIAHIPETAKVIVWQRNLDKVRAQISHLGAINLAAIEEFEQQSERKAYLDNQDNDLNKGLATLEEAIRKIDKETRTRFKTTYDAVNADLSKLFPKVFGGGKAYLALTDDDLLETGVTIMAQPPGKKNSTIHLLSGGEKALTALSLVFAIFRLNPAPFCMLDEVDAPLDDANVERFCRLLKEMSQSVQFVYISHNKITMEMADQLIGVTMHEPGVSRIVAVDIEEAVALADAE
ncbi:chromosome segregation protein SMC [Shewanella sp. 4_MG-2023]|uniref:chromosome segregation protein SMC n=1 Tax=Shewanella sp. 4_MG-2023 TaxID=3062652 RepID=UPI0026E46591|nr:chromosome segregation protein SMC [Shewanella sp. 4_MG-2023]MDO6678203.1 chromosome segregation protein SMC [Shewanella sp. 4_MG-2023]